MAGTASNTEPVAEVRNDLRLDAPSVAFLASYPPRRCGIASFTQELLRAVATYEGRSPGVIALDEPGLLPFVEPEQVSSGTLGWAMGSGRAVISTEFRYARELLSGGDGRLVPIRDSSAIARELLRLLEDREQLARLGRRAHEASWHTRWEDVGGRYHELFNAVRSRHSDTSSWHLDAIKGAW